MDLESSLILVLLALLALLLLAAAHQQSIKYNNGHIWQYYWRDHSEQQVVLVVVGSQELVGLWVGGRLHHEVLLALFAKKFQQVLCIHPALARIVGKQDEIVEVLQRNLPALADQLLLDQFP